MKKLIVLLVVAAGSSCTPRTDSARDIAELMELHHQQRKAHVSRNASLLVDQFADNLIQVNRGKIDTVISKENAAKRFQGYFDAVEFKKWDDSSTPTIRFSDDHSVAYMIVSKEVVLEIADSLGNRSEETTHFAWMSVYRKQQNGEWKLEGMASTSTPSSVRPVSNKQ